MRTESPTELLQAHRLEYEWIPRLRREPHPSPSCVAIGMFDGVHRGHRGLLRAARAYADQADLQLVAVTFGTHPRNALSSAAAVDLIQSPVARYDRLLSTGVDAVMALPFSMGLAEMPPDEFLDSLCEEIRIDAVFAGQDFRFGAERAGDCTLLKRQGVDRGFHVTIVPPVVSGERAISSTRIRNAIADGFIEEATSLLGVAHGITPNVIAFDSDRQIAMFHFPSAIAKPPSGLYLGRIRHVPYIPVMVEVSRGAEPSVIRHCAQEPVDSLGSLYASPVILEFLDTA